MLNYIKGDGFMDSSISLKKLKATYERIVKQSKILDNYVQIQFEQKKKAS